jgi:ABC-type nitrate/sulfonate/bicarbonate transport system substrate-binding protein
MKILYIVLIILAGVIFICWLGLQFKPAPFPAYAAQTPEFKTIPLPENLPAPVERYYRAVYGEDIPVIESVVFQGQATIRPFMNIPLPARFAALSAGAVDASVMWFPVTEIAKSQGFRKLFDLKTIFPEWPYETFAARETWLAKEKIDASKFLRAYQRGVKHTVENKDDGIRAIRKYVKMDPAYAPAGYDEYRESFPLNGQIAEKVIPTVIEEEFRTGRLKRKITAEEMVDRSFIKALGR